MAAALGEDDTPNLHFSDTMEAGAGLVDPEAASILADGGQGGGGGSRPFTASGSIRDASRTITSSGARPPIAATASFTPPATRRAQRS